ncbi:alpha/beta hydrolase [Streptomyces sp. NPDC050610]|uniref:alpha/beta fold hydrolase n=1 Tax=Streptomyces sp. NPDC050610 TaxID=3157097 RepID=UPI00343EE94D
MTIYTEHVDKAAGRVRLAYDQGGTASDQPPMLFVHGAGCDRSHFERQFTHFAPSHPVASLDLRGHGESDHPDPAVPGTYEVEAFAEDVLAVSAAAGFDRPIVVGHSLGGLIALTCATRPDAIRAAVLVDPAPILDERFRSVFAGSIANVEADEDGSWRRDFITAAIPPTDTYRRDEIITGFGSAPPAIAAANWRVVADFDGASTLPKTQVPILAIYAREPDPGLRDAPNMTIGQTVGAGHFNQLQAPDQVNAMIARFLETTAL